MPPWMFFLYQRRDMFWPFGCYVLGVLLFATIMRNLLAFHDFTATFYIGIHTLLFVALAWSLPRRVVTPVLVLTLALFLASVFAGCVSPYQRFTRTDPYYLSPDRRSLHSYAPNQPGWTPGSRVPELRY